MSVKRQLAWRAKQAEAEQRKYTVVYYVLVRRNAYVEAVDVDEAIQTATQDLLADIAGSNALAVGKQARVVHVSEDQRGEYKVTLEVSVAYAAVTKAENAVAAIEATTFKCGDADGCGGWCDRSWVAVVKNENGAIVWDDADTVRRYTADFGAL